MTEFEFTRALIGRDPETPGCVGPTVILGMADARIAALCEAFGSPPAARMLALARVPLTDPAVFSMCGAHWADLCCLAILNGSRQARPDWVSEGIALQVDVFRSTGWDPKELANLLTSLADARIPGDGH